MGVSKFLGPILFVLGVAALAIAFSRGEAQLSLVVFVPVITATGPWAALGILLLVAGFVTAFLTWPFRIGTMAVPEPAAPPRAMAEEVPPTQPTTRRWGGVLFLGPVPIVFGSDAKVTRTMLILGLLLFLALLALSLFFIFRAI